MKYMLLIYEDEQALNETEREHCYEEATQLVHQLKMAGQFLAAAPLYPHRPRPASACRRADEL